MKYAELHCASAFSFLEGASQPEDLVDRAAELGLGAVALVDRNGLSGAPRFFKAATQAGIKPLVGAEIVLDDVKGHTLIVQRSPFHPETETVESTKRLTCNVQRLTRDRDTESPKLPGPLGLVPDPPPPGTPLPRLTLLAENRRGYQNLCRLITEAARDRPKGKARAGWHQVAAHAEGLHCLTGGPEGVIAQRLVHRGLEAARRELDHLGSIFPGRLHVELQRHHLREEEHRNRALADLARRLRLPVVVTGGVRYAHRRDKELADVLACIREGVTLDTAGRLLEAQRERHLKSPLEMVTLFADTPRAVSAAAELAGRLDFTLSDLGYRFPDYPLPPGETPSSYLRQVTWNEARARYRPLTARTQAQLARELDLIEKLDLAGYFLIVWDIVQFCRARGHPGPGPRLGRQQRGLLRPVHHRGGPGEDGAPVRALPLRGAGRVAGHRSRPALGRPAREGHPARLPALRPPRRRHDRQRHHLPRPLGGAGGGQGAGFLPRPGGPDFQAARTPRLDRDPRGRTEPRPGARHRRARSRRCRRAEHFKRLWWRIHHLPRHLGQHSGGMVIARGRLDEVVPLEPAAMAGRTVIQWDKDDCADLGLIKVDLLGLGMLAALEEAIPMIRTHEGVDIDLAHLPPDDEATYEMLRRADTVGVFQVESRAQMASLPRNRPRHFYDLVVQVAIIRPGPIVGNMTNPYLERRQGREPVTYPHPSLEPVLKRTLGRAAVPGAAAAHRHGGGRLLRRRGRGAAARHGLQTLRRAHGGASRERSVPA